jgi:hypothetical protein
VHPRPAGESLLGAIPRSGATAAACSIWPIPSIWELLGIWAWLPAFYRSLLSQGMLGECAAFAALTYVANIAGSIIGGTMADRWGRLQTILLWSSVSLPSRFPSAGWSPPIGLLWRSPASTFAGIADSSTHLEIARRERAGALPGVAYAVRRWSASAPAW